MVTQLLDAKLISVFTAGTSAETPRGHSMSARIWSRFAARRREQMAVIAETH
jgi:hypothetical protein